MFYMSNSLNLENYSDALAFHNMSEVERIRFKEGCGGGWGVKYSMDRPPKANLPQGP